MAKATQLKTLKMDCFAALTVSIPTRMVAQIAERQNRQKQKWLHNGGQWSCLT